MAGAEEEEGQHFNERLQRIAAAATAFDLIRIKHAREREETDAQLAAYDEATSSRGIVRGLESLRGSRHGLEKCRKKAVVASAAGGSAIE